MTDAAATIGVEWQFLVYNILRQLHVVPNHPSCVCQSGGAANPVANTSRLYSIQQRVARNLRGQETRSA